ITNPSGISILPQFLEIKNSLYHTKNENYPYLPKLIDNMKIEDLMDRYKKGTLTTDDYLSKISKTIDKKQEKIPITDETFRKKTVSTIEDN
ncbi:unnamed protein product, partial [Didymodactylos carnosus]